MSLKIRIETITEDVEIKEVFCDYCNVHIGNMDENDCIHKTDNSSVEGNVKVLINNLWYYIQGQICKECAQQKEEAIVALCKAIGLK